MDWLGRPAVLYTRFDHVLTAPLAERVAERFTRLMESAVVVHYFNDTGNVESYELSALMRMFETMRSMRSQLARIVILPWSGALGQKAADFAAAFECFEYAASRHAFEMALLTAAPSWRPPQTQMLASGGGRSATSRPPESAGVHRSTAQPLSGATYITVRFLAPFGDG